MSAPDNNYTARRSHKNHSFVVSVYCAKRLRGMPQRQIQPEEWQENSCTCIYRLWGALTASSCRKTALTITKQPPKQILCHVPLYERSTRHKLPRASMRWRSSLGIQRLWSALARPGLAAAAFQTANISCCTGSDSDDSPHGTWARRNGTGCQREGSQRCDLCENMLSEIQDWFSKCQD